MIPLALRKTTLVLAVVALVGFAAGPLHAAPPPADLGQTSVLGLESVLIDGQAQILSGDVVASDEPTEEGIGVLYGCGARLCVGPSATTAGGYALRADSVELASGAAVGGDVHFNDLSGKGSVEGNLYPGLNLPVIAELPVASAPEPRPGAPDVVVKDGTTMQLAEGNYGMLVVGTGARLILTGGEYNAYGLAVDNDGRVEAAADSLVWLADKASLGTRASIGPADGSGVTPAGIVVHVGGINGAAGKLDEEPRAAEIGDGAVVEANLLALAGGLRSGQEAQLTGAFLARHVEIGAGSRVALASTFANQPPTALPQEVETSGDAPLTLLLQGVDPEGDDMTFKIVSAPKYGTLGDIVEAPAPFPGEPVGCNPRDPECTPPEPGRTEASVVYTPESDKNLEDSFTFAVTDSAGGVGTAVVTLNDSGDPGNPGPPVTEVTADDTTADTSQGVPVSVSLSGRAPTGVALSFDITANPEKGDLGRLTQTSDTTASVEYRPFSGFVGVDTFRFVVCGVVSGKSQCDEGTAQVSVQGTLADSFQVTLLQGSSAIFDLIGNAGAEKRLRVDRGIAGRASLKLGASVAGGVADSDGDGKGDNVSPLPGKSPLNASAAVGADAGAGAKGTARFQAEWDIREITAAFSTQEIASASVTLHTVKGEHDQLDTAFYAGGTQQDGRLAPQDFEASAAPIGVVMPVPKGSVGSQGTFSFDVTSALIDALSGDRTTLSLQGRVDESLAGREWLSGLQVLTTATANVSKGYEPTLTVVTQDEPAPLVTYSILELPRWGLLYDGAGQLIKDAPFELSGPTLTYVPMVEYFGPDQLVYQVEDYTGAVASAAVDFLVTPLFAGPCAYNGRPPGCTPDF